MTDSISNTPRNGALGWLSDALGAARDFGNKMDLKEVMRPVSGIIPQSIRDKFSDEPMGAGDALLGHSPEEVNEWAHGNLPLQVPPTSYIPQFKRRYTADGSTNRAEGVADTAGALSALAPLAKLAPGLAKGALSAGDTVLQHAFQPVPRAQAQLGAFKMPGGNANDLRLNHYLSDTLGVITPEDAAENYTNGLPTNGRAPATHTWGSKQLSNYLRKDIGTTKDPLLAVEKDLPNLHLPEGSMHTQEGIDANLNDPYQALKAAEAKGEVDKPSKYITYNALKDMDAHSALSSEPLTPWGHKTRTEMYGNNPESYSEELGSSGIDAPSWLGKASPDTKIWGLVDPSTDHLGFGHVLDYLDAAQKMHTSWGPETGKDLGASFQQNLPLHQALGDVPMAMGPQEYSRLQGLHNAGLTLTPEQVARTSVADAVRKTAAWNEHLANNAGASNPDLARGIQAVHRDYGDGMKWVKLGEAEPSDVKLGNNGLPEGWSIRPGSSIDAATGKPWAPGEQTHPWELHPPPELKSNDGTAPWGFRTTHISEDDARATAFSHQQELNAEQALNDLAAGLNAEGEAMGHCVGGYCEDVADRGTSIYSLRDANNNPHVTIETRQRRDDPRYQIPDHVQTALDEQAYNHPDVAAARTQHGDESDEYMTAMENARSDLYDQWDKANPQQTQDIIQIKGKQNAAPVDKYLPYVQDFVKNGQWGRVGDLKNTGLHDLSQGNPVERELGRGVGGADVDKWNSYMQANPGARFASKQDVLDHLSSLQAPADPSTLTPGDTAPGYAKGGSVLPGRYTKKAALLARLRD